MVSYIIRPVGLHDQTLLWSWRNDPQTRAMERITDIIPRASYARWFRLTLANERYRMLLAETDVTAIAVFHIYLRPNGKAEIGICLNPAYRGLGLARGLLERFVASARAELDFSHICAAVKVANTPSRRLFAGAGYHIDVVANDIIYFFSDPGNVEKAQSSRTADCS